MRHRDPSSVWATDHVKAIARLACSHHRDWPMCIRLWNSEADRFFVLPVWATALVGSSWFVRSLYTWQRISCCFGRHERYMPRRKFIFKDWIERWQRESSACSDRNTPGPGLLTTWSTRLSSQNSIHSFTFGHVQSSVVPPDCMTTEYQLATATAFANQSGGFCVSV